MLEKIILAGTACTSYQSASTVLAKLADLSINEKRVERLTRDVGTERVAERDGQTADYEAMRIVGKFETPVGVPGPDLAVVMVDGGRLQVLDSAEVTAKDTKPEPLEESSLADLALDEEAPPTKNKHWREDRIGLLMIMNSRVALSDPYPQIPDGFLDPVRMRRLARELTQHAKITVGSPEGVSPAEEVLLTVAGPKENYQPPKVSSRRLLASRHDWEHFTPILAAEAWLWGFQKATRKAFVADGAKCNWTLHKRCFAQFVPILDFIHALSYVYAAATAGQTEEIGWACYEKWIQWVWQGQVALVIAALVERQRQIGIPDQSDGPTTPRRVVAKTLTYLENHQDKMRYDVYRRDGLPITSSHVESAVKLISRRVKGTEKFWSEDGAEAILQLRADHLSDNQPLDGFWQRRQAAATGCRPYRRAG